MEWLEYHIMLGIDHMVIYDRDDALEGILRRYTSTGVVTRLNFPAVNRTMSTPTQESINRRANPNPNPKPNPNPNPNTKALEPPVPKAFKIPEALKYPSQDLQGDRFAEDVWRNMSNEYDEDSNPNPNPNPNWRNMSNEYDEDFHRISNFRDSSPSDYSLKRRLQSYSSGGEYDSAYDTAAVNGTSYTGAGMGHAPRLGNRSLVGLMRHGNF